MKKDKGEAIGGVLFVVSIIIIGIMMWRYGAVKTAQFNESQYRWELSWADRLPR